VSTVIALPEHRERRFEALCRRQPEAPPWVAALRAEAFERLRVLGFPTTRNEDWKYTNVRPVVEAEWRGEGGSAPSQAPVELPGFEGPRLSFVNGRIAPGLGSVQGLPEGVLLGGLAEALRGVRREELREHLASSEGWRDEAFAALNTASFEDGAVLLLPEGCVLPHPVHLQFLTVPGVGHLEQQPRLLIVAGAGAEAHLVETWTAYGEAPSFTNVVTEVRLGANAALEHVKLQQESRATSHLSWTAVRQERDSRYRSRLLSLGGSLARNGLRVQLAGEGADCELDGLYVGASAQHQDNQVFVHHAVPHASSRQLYKSVLTDRAHGIFTGRVLVDPGAQKTEAHQQNRNLVLSENAVADTRPQLEIYADDVRCTHGATIGRLDPDALFYLRARGLDLATARSLLTQSFALEVLERVQVPSLAAELCTPVHRRLERIAGGEEAR
jgi:Fe-S cluster assembly protein SufD